MELMANDPDIAHNDDKGEFNLVSCAVSGKIIFMDTEDMKNEKNRRA